jgi:hypothetical protein
MDLLYWPKFGRFGFSLDTNKANVEKLDHVVLVKNTEFLR